MLDIFVTENRHEIIKRCRAKVAARPTPAPTPAELAYGIPQFLEQLIEKLQDRTSSTSGIDKSAALHARRLQSQGFTVSQVVHDYGDVCQSITELALEQNAPINVDEFHTLNACLDDAIASAVTEYGRGNHSVMAAESARVEEQLGFLAHEIRNLVGTASTAFDVLSMGNVGIGGSTGAVLKRALTALSDLINRSVVEVRLRHVEQDRAQFRLAEFLSELAPAAALDASVRGLAFRVDPGDETTTIDADRSILAAVVANLLQNAFKFTRPGTTVILRGSATADRAVIEIEDECGGLPDGGVSDLFRPYQQRAEDRTGMGLGLAFCRWGAEANGGRIYARSLPGHGCVFTLNLPRFRTDLVGATAPATPAAADPAE
ncbi:MAG: HAMP domain-containing sensor histidine kinase [Vicinamibacterales bacterium]